jgi:hypothetical protein
MVVAELDIVGIPITPAKTNAPLIVHADTMLPGTIAREQLQAIAGRCPQEFETRSGVNQIELSLGAVRHIARQALNVSPHEKSSRPLVGNRLDHGP